jgi:hypothetical protein
MDEPLLREIANEFLVPLFSGARLENKSEKSVPRAAPVTLRESTAIGFKVNREDPYKLILSRRQPFARDGEAVVPELAVVRAFTDVLRQREKALDSPLKHDLLSTFQRRIVARAIGSSEHEEVLLLGIDQLAKWADGLYEGVPVSSALGFRLKAQPRGGVKLADFGKNDFGAVLGNGHDTLLEFDSLGGFIGYQSLSLRKSVPSFCPLRQGPIAEWTTKQESRVALTLNRLGEILVFRDHQLLFARRSGQWSFLTHEPVLTQMGPHHDRPIREAVYETCLDSSFARTGACIGIVSRSRSSEWKRTVVAEDDYLEGGTSTKARAIARMVAGEKFQNLDRKLRQELVALDGATIISDEGDVLAVGTILKIPGGSEGGGRLAAAQALGKLGVGIKVSQDGGITGFRPKRSEPAFRVM